MKRFHSTSRVLLFLFLVFAGIWTVSACTCRRAAPCESYDKADVVFVGKVTGVKPRVEGRYDYDVTFEVLESFGENAMGPQITVKSRFDEGTCGYIFKPDETYVVFSWRAKAPNVVENEKVPGTGIQLSTGMCSGTRPVKAAEETLKYLRNLPQPGSGGAILGKVNESIRNYSAEGVRSKPYQGLKIRAELVENKAKAYYGTTDSDGAYEINAPPGNYTVRPEIETGLSFRSDHFNKQIKVGDRKCVIDNILIVNDSEISGRVIDPSGKTYPKLLSLHLIPADKQRDEENFDYRSVYVDEGVFRTTGVRPGRYFLSLNYASEPDDDSPFPTYFYPGTGFRKDAGMIEIGKASKVTGLVFRLPKKFKNRKITGTVVWENGKPVVGAEVELHDVEFDRRAVFNNPTTSAGGGFRFTTFEGRRYKIKVVIWKRQRDGSDSGIADGESEEFILDSATKPFRIVLKAIDPEEKSIFTTTVRTN